MQQKTAQADALCIMKIAVNSAVSGPIKQHQSASFTLLHLRLEFRLWLVVERARAHADVASTDPHNIQVRVTRKCYRWFRRKVKW